jgi:SAM-dependent methyltransferase
MCIIAHQVCELLWSETPAPALIVCGRHAPVAKEKTMTITNAMPESALTAIREFWSGGDYDRLASYGSAAEAAHLVRFAGVRAGDTVVDVGTGSGIAAIVAAQSGARVTGIDPTPALLAKARDNAAIAGVDVIWHEGVAEALPFADASFDVVLSQYAHMFSTDPQHAITEMLRVLKPGGRIAFAAWTPEGLAPRLMGLSFAYLPPPPGTPPPSPFLWGEPNGVRHYLGDRVRDVRFEHAALMLPALSPGHARRIFEETFSPTVMIVRMLADRIEELASWRRQHDGIAREFFADGRLRFDYLLTRAVKQ